MHGTRANLNDGNRHETVLELGLAKDGIGSSQLIGRMLVLSAIRSLGRAPLHSGVDLTLQTERSPVLQGNSRAVVVDLANAAYYRMPTQINGRDIIVPRRKRSYRFHLRWGAILEQNWAVESAPDPTRTFGVWSAAAEMGGKRSFADQSATTSRYPASYSSRVSSSA